MSPDERQYESATLARGLRGNLVHYIQRVSGRQAVVPYLWQGLVLTLLSGLPTVGASVLRALAYKTVLERVGSGCFIERDVRWQVPRRVSLGRRVMIGEGCFLDAHSLTGHIVLDDDVWLSRGCYVITDENMSVEIGAHSYLGHRSLLYGHSGIRVGRDVLIANDVQLICGNHTFDRRDVPIRAQPPSGQPIVVEDDVWLGASAIVLGGVTVGKGSVVGAGSIVTHSLPAYSIARGAPAKVVGVRGEPSGEEPAE